MGKACSRSLHVSEDDRWHSIINEDLAATPPPMGHRQSLPPPPLTTSSTYDRLKTHQALDRLVQIRRCDSLPDKDTPSDDQQLRPPHRLEDSSLLNFAEKGFQFYVYIYGLRLKHVPQSAVRSTSRAVTMLKRRSLTVGASGSRLSNVSNLCSDGSPPSSAGMQFILVLSWVDDTEIRRTDAMTADGTQVLFRDSLVFKWREEDDLRKLADKNFRVAAYSLEYGRNVEFIGDVEIDILALASGPIHNDLALDLSGVDVKKRSDSSVPKRSPRLQFDCRVTQICHLRVTPIEILTDIESVANGVEPISESVSLGGEYDVRLCRSKSMAHLDKRPAPPTGVAPQQAINPLDGQEDPATIEIAKSAAGGHTADDERAPVVAEWQIDFLPTGVSNPARFVSRWTDLTSRPHWIAVDVTNFDLERVSSCQENLGTIKDASPIGLGSSDIRRCASQNLSRVERETPISASELPASETADLATTDKMVDAAGRRLPARRGLTSSAGMLRSISLRPLGACESRDLRLSRLAHDSLQRTHPLSAMLHQPSDLVPSHRKQTWSGDQADQICSPPKTLAAETDAANECVQARYKAIAEACRGGRTLSSVLVQEALPTFTIETTGDAIRQYHIHMRLWAKPLAVGRPKIFAEAWIPFFKLFDTDVVDFSNRFFYDAAFSETLWQEGRSVGHVRGLLVFQDAPLIRQMLAGVQTELGFARLVTPSIDVISDQPVSSEMLRISNLQGHLNQHLFASSTLANHLSDRPEDMPSRSPVMNLQTTCEQMIEILSSTSDTTSTKLVFAYESLSSLLTGQRVLLDLAKHILDTMDNVPWHVRGAFGNLLLLILRRGELDIGNLLPQIPDCARSYPEQSLRTLTKAAAFYEKKKRSVQPKSPGSGRSTVQLFSRLRPSNRKRRERQETPDETLSLSSRSTDTAPDELSSIMTPSQRTVKISTTQGTSVDGDDHGTDEGSRSRSVSPVLRAPSFHPTVEIRPEDRPDLHTYRRRMKIAKTYLAVLLKLCETSLAKLRTEALFESQRRHVCTYLAVLYTRLPPFRAELLRRCLTEEERSAILPGWRGQSFKLDKATLDAHDQWCARPFSGVYELQLILDWAPFHNALEDFYGTEALEHVLSNIVDSEETSGWDRNFLRPRGITFFTFLESWIRSIGQSLDISRRFSAQKDPYLKWQPPPSTTHRWDLIPGYTTMLKAFLIELRIRPVAKFPDALLNCSAALLINDALLSVFIRIVLSRTSVYSREQVFAVFNYIDFWLEVLTVKGYPLPLTLDYKFIGRAIEATLTCDLALQTAKALWFLYKRINLFATQKNMLRLLIDLLTYRNFFNLFLNWSWLVRKCVISFVLYRLCDQARTIVAKHAEVKGGTTPDTTFYVTPEERLCCWAYVQMTHNLKVLEIPSVFPERFLTDNISRILGQPPPPDTQAANASPQNSSGLPHLIWNVPYQLPQVHHSTTPISQAPLKLHHDESAELDEPAATRGSPQEGLRMTSGRVKPMRVYRAGIKRLRRRKSQKGDDEPEVLLEGTEPAAKIEVVQYANPLDFLPQAIPLDPKKAPYIKAVRSEFLKDMELYKVWVISGSSEVPPMHIPASPLDTNVEVPLEEE